MTYENRVTENSRRNPPTEPGMYRHPEEKWPALLDDKGRWSDGWGNDLGGS